jgi:hypothetical protein
MGAERVEVELGRLCASFSLGPFLSISLPNQPSGMDGMVSEDRTVGTLNHSAAGSDGILYVCH